MELYIDPLLEVDESNKKNKKKMEIIKKKNPDLHHKLFIPTSNQQDQQNSCHSSIAAGEKEKENSDHYIQTFF